GVDVVRRQPAEMRARALGGPGRTGAPSRRADARRRRGGEGRDPPPPARAGRPRPRDPRRFFGDAGAAGAQRPDRGDAAGAPGGRAGPGAGDGARGAAPGHGDAVSEAAAVPLPAEARATWWQRVGPLLGLALLCVVLAIASPHFLTLDNLLNVLRQSAINAVLALGQLVVIVTAGIDLSIGSIMGLTIVLLALMMRGGTPSLLACVLTVLAGAAVGLLNGLLLTRLKLPHPFISTLGTMNVARGAALLLASGVPISGLPAGFREVVAGSAFRIPSPVIVAGALYVAGHLFLT